MKSIKGLRPSPALFVAMAALVMAMSGAATALPGKGDVKSNDIAKGAVRSQAIARNAIQSNQVRGKSLKGNDLKDGTIESKQVATDGLDSSDLSDLHVQGDLVRVAATAGATASEARSAAPETALYEKGQLSFYAKCFTDDANTDTIGEIYARSAADGAALDGTADLPNDDGVLLNSATAEVDRVLARVVVTIPDTADFDAAQGSAWGPDATTLRLLSTIGVSQGDIPGLNGVFGEGTACTFELDAIG